MNKVPKNAGMLGGTVAFSAVLLVAILRGQTPMSAVGRAGVCALVAAAVAWFCAQLAVGVLYAGIGGQQQEGPSEESD